MKNFNEVMNSDIIFHMKQLNFKQDIIQKFKG